MVHTAVLDHPSPRLPNLVAMAMNGWGDAEPAWWLNLQAHPDATVDLDGMLAPIGLLLAAVTVVGSQQLKARG